MRKNKSEIIKEWFEKADNDLLSARRLMEIPPPILDTACFHCQQVVEKYLKAYLIYQGKDIIKTHDVTLLLKSCSEFDYGFESINMKNLEDFSVDIRYPDDALIPSLEEAKEYLQIAEDIKELVRKKIDLGSL